MQGSTGTSTSTIPSLPVPTHLAPHHRIPPAAPRAPSGTLPNNVAGNTHPSRAHVIKAADLTAVVYTSVSRLGAGASRAHALIPSVRSHDRHVLKDISPPVRSIESGSVRMAPSRTHLQPLAGVDLWQPLLYQGRSCGGGGGARITLCRRPTPMALSALPRLSRVSADCRLALVFLPYIDCVPPPPLQPRRPGLPRHTTIDRPSKSWRKQTKDRGLASRRRSV
jgi:hypothetical protein